MKLTINIPWNTMSHEEKQKILYNNYENIILYNEYMVKII